MHLGGIKRTVGAAFDRPTMQRLLFHGTDAIDMIVNAPTAGFLPLLVGAWGPRSPAASCSVLWRRLGVPHTAHMF